MKTLTLTLNERQLATIRAALRYWQQGSGGVNGGDPTEDLDRIATLSGRIAALRDEEINALCWYLNMEGAV